MWGPLLVVVLSIFVRSEFMVGANREGHPINSSQETLGTIWAQDTMRGAKTGYFVLACVQFF